MATQTSTQRKASAQKAAATRRRKAAERSQTTAQTAEQRAQAELNRLQAVQAKAERAVLIPVGAALVARDALVEATKPDRLETNLRKFERRGATARNRTLREAKRVRTRVERELRQRRRELERQVANTRRDVQKQAESLVERVAALA